MLTITDRALKVLRTVTGHPRLAESSGLRIARRSPSSESLQVKPVQGPEPGDVVIERSKGRLFLGPVAARRLRDKVLDARTDAEGRVEFVLKRRR